MRSARWVCRVAMKVHNGDIVTSVHYKPTDKHAYLKYDSPTILSSTEIAYLILSFCFSGVYALIMTNLRMSVLRWPTSLGAEVTLRELSPRVSCVSPMYSVSMHYVLRYMTTNTKFPLSCPTVPFLAKLWILSEGSRGSCVRRD